MATGSDVDAEAKCQEAERQAILEEYKALRAEILMLVEARNRFLILDLTGIGALFVAAIQFNPTFFW
jgi:hypothetical protein